MGNRVFSAKIAAAALIIVLLISSREEFRRFANALRNGSRNRADNHASLLRFRNCTEEDPRSSDRIELILLAHRAERGAIDLTGR